MANGIDACQEANHRIKDPNTGGYHRTGRAQPSKKRPQHLPPSPPIPRHEPPSHLPVLFAVDGGKTVLDDRHPVLNAAEQGANNALLPIVPPDEAVADLVDDHRVDARGGHRRALREQKRRHCVQVAEKRSGNREEQASWQAASYQAVYLGHGSQADSEAGD